MKKATGKSESIIVTLAVRAFWGALVAGIMFMSLSIYDIFDFTAEIWFLLSVGVGILFALFGKDLMKWIF